MIENGSERLVDDCFCLCENDAKRLVIANEFHINVRQSRLRRYSLNYESALYPWPCVVGYLSSSHKKNDSHRMYRNNSYTYKRKYLSVSTTLVS